MPILHQLAPSDTAQHPNGGLPALPAHTLERLYAEGIFSLSDWRRLGRKRLRIFGIPTAIAKMIDAAAREAGE